MEREGGDNKKEVGQDEGDEVMEEAFAMGIRNQKSPKFQRVPKTNRIMTHFHLLRTQNIKFD